MHRQTVALLWHLQHHVLNPSSFLDGCGCPVEVLSLAGTRALPEAFSQSLDLLVSHTPSFPVPQSSLLGPVARLGSAKPLQLPCLTFLTLLLVQHLCTGVDPLLLLQSFFCLFYQMRPV